MTALVQSRVEAGVATLTLDSPANRNALSAQLLAELVDDLRAAVADPDVRVIVLTHEGRAFCSGADLKEARGPAAGQPAVAFPAVLQELWEAPKPVVARVAGPARAGGLGLLGASDIVVCADTVTFAFTEVRLGVVPAIISASLLPLLVPRAAKELFLTGESFDARRAVEIGLVTAAVPAAALDDEVRRYVDLLLRGAPEALAATKSLLQRQPRIPDDLNEMSALSVRHFTSAEGQEGMAAFAAKRDPSWVRRI
ncbi:MAG: enoyl-CoA hydratase-related protein [Actinomycetota bacterium]|nr:enoyl-CoA hydratase-related protein [Actinomycetota bacterium]